MSQMPVPDPDEEGKNLAGIRYVIDKTWDGNPLQHEPIEVISRLIILIVTFNHLNYIFRSK